MDVDIEILREFLTESRENLDQLDREFVALESDPSAAHRIATIFRTIHTIKGTTGFLGLSRLETLTHAGENLLSRLRDGVIRLTPEIATALLSMVDTVRVHLDALDTTGAESSTNSDALIATLDRLTHSPTRPALEATTGPTPPATHSQRAAPLASQRPVVRPLSQPVPTPAATSTNASTRPAIPPATSPSTPAMQLVSAPSHPRPSDASPAPAQPRTGAAEPPGADGHDALANGNEARTAVAETTVRVDVTLLDRLMNLVGELVLARNQILQFTTQGKDAGFNATSQRLNLITTELQEGVMKTRMQPIGNVWKKFPRVVRDLALACGKQVRIEMEGQGTELDRTIIEAIKDPLMHLVRNSMDHGIELPEARVKAGKSPIGRLSMRAYHEGGRVNIEISDDGGGIDPEKIRRRAIQRGLITPERASRMSDAEALHVIFVPGFSTADKVTHISGRGVGMDVVKSNVEKIGGTVDVESHPGRGTAFKIKIPLTLAIIPALVVSCDGDRYAIPQVSLLELVRLEGAQARAGVELIHGAPVYRLRGNLLPLVYLRKALNLPAAPNRPDPIVNIVVLQADDRQFGLVVDAVNDTEEIVVKPLGKELKGLSAYAGATIMGDGRVALILDVMGIAQRSSVVSGVRDRALAEANAATQAAVDDRKSLLLFQVRDGGAMAVPLSMVSRLEEFAPDALERAGDQEVVQYRGEILPLIDLREIFGGGRGGRREGGETLQVVVYSERSRSVGLVVDRILDIVNEVVTVKHRSNRRGLLGAATIQGRVTDLLDVHALLPPADDHYDSAGLTAFAAQ